MEALNAATDMNLEIDKVKELCTRVLRSKYGHMGRAVTTIVENGWSLAQTLSKGEYDGEIKGLGLVWKSEAGCSK